MIAKPLKTLLMAALMAPLVSTPALAQMRPEAPAVGYRADQPQVMQPPPQENPDAPSIRATDKFRRWYAGAHSPPMLIFWNRELTDEATTRFADTSVAREESRSAKTGGGQQGGPEDGYQSKVSTQETSRRALNGGAFTPMDPMLSARLETAFQAAWLGTGVEVVDRNALIRKMSTVASAQDRTDTQMLESAALEQGIEYLIEVLPQAAAGSPSGYTFLVKVKHIPSSTVMAQFLSQAQPPPGAAHWVATAGGFEKRRENLTSLETIGAQLAVETMGRLSR